MQLVVLKKTIGCAGIGEPVSFAWSTKLSPIATNLPLPATQAPIRGLPFTSGSRFVSSLRRAESAASDSVAGSMSFTLRDRSRSLPSASTRPGFSLPAGP